ncbi:drug/metabolite transporter (DMT)-like permease [Sphaerotilus hippei]|uniref:Drug/metabolite transporter (DMT)-like permease n=1 Tax=Sphaerotilus hippei TaxID=744406 RepID=A0A318H8X3_9BURK|nr:DMT family transporter [Sphaerotilus hippei]PXW94568.1 drug/metabolite transporter (DMT)-like permease [Sphaerotilus hippei]
MSKTSFPDRPYSVSAEQRGLWLGLLGVLIFAMTLPMTRLAVGPLEDPQLPPVFVTAGRAAGAGLLGALYLMWVRAPWPLRADRGLLLVSALGSVVGFPLFLGLALREVPAMHAAVITGVLPLCTAVVAAWHLRQRPSTGFWACALLGAALVLMYAARQGGGRLVAADGLLLLAMLSGAIAYVSGARLCAHRPAEQVISWVLVFSLPLTLPIALWQWPAMPVRPSAWGALAYVTVFSMWLGFFAWYRGLAMGGTVRVSQVQMVQPFLSLLLAAPVLGEALQAETLWFAAAVMAVVWVGRRLSVGRPTRIQVDQEETCT